MFNEVHFEIESKCILNCKHCSSKSMRQLSDRCYSMEDINNVISLLDDPVHIYFTGGEPLLSKELNEIMSKISHNRPNLDIGIFTCGVVKIGNEISYVSYEEAKKLREHGLTNCYISIYDKDEYIHDNITNIEMSFNCTKKTIENLMSAGIVVKAHLVINKYNINNLDNIIKYLYEMGIYEVRILRMVKGGSAIDNWEEIGLDYSIQDKAIEEIISKIDQYNIKITISGFPELAPCRPFKGAYKCQSGTNVIYITYEGDIYPCACTKGNEKFRIGHISDTYKISEFRNGNIKKYNDICLNSPKDI